MKEFIKLVFKFTLIMFAVIALIITAVVVYSKVTGFEITEMSENIFGDNKETVTVLIAGLHPDGPLTDFIMIAKYNPESGKINALSIPRDTKVVGTIDGKINSAYAKGRDITKLQDKVKDLTAIEAEYYVLFDTGAVKKMVDAIGGIPMNVPIDMQYDDNEQGLHINLKKGYQVLDGNKAEQFIRFRKNNDGSGYPLGDVQRIEAQQEFIKAGISQVLKPSTILKLPELISLGFESVKTDIKVSEVLGYLDDIKNFDLNNLRMETLPGEGAYIGPTSYFVHEPNETKTLVEEMFIKELTLTTASNNDTLNVVNLEEATRKKKSDITIEVLNATNRSGLASSVGEKIKAEGYNVTKIGNYKSTSKVATTLINKTEEDYATELKKFLGVGKVKNEIDSASKVDVTIILGSDY